MIVEQLYDALIEAGASEAKAREAAKAVADFQDAMRDVKVGFADVKTNFADLKSRFEEVKSTQRLHSWMLTTSVAMMIAVLFKVFSK